MTSSAPTAERFNDTPTDFDAFVARQHGVAVEQAAELIVSWMESYESPSARGPRRAEPHRAEPQRSGVAA
jgi:hypothetical protein